MLLWIFRLQPKIQILKIRLPGKSQFLSKITHDMKDEINKQYAQAV